MKSKFNYIATVLVLDFYSVFKHLLNWFVALFGSMERITVMAAILESTMRS